MHTYFLPSSVFYVAVVAIVSHAGIKYGVTIKTVALGFQAFRKTYERYRQAIDEAKV